MAWVVMQAKGREHDKSRIASLVEHLEGGIRDNGTDKTMTGGEKVEKVLAYLNES